MQSCVHVVLDFMSPEHVNECVQLTDEIRLLPEDHKAKVDKLEVNLLEIFIHIYIYTFFFPCLCMTWTSKLKEFLRTQVKKMALHSMSTAIKEIRELTCTT